MIFLCLTTVFCGPPVDRLIPQDTQITFSAIFWWIKILFSTVEIASQVSNDGGIHTLSSDLGNRIQTTENGGKFKFKRKHDGNRNAHCRDCLKGLGSLHMVTTLGWHRIIWSFENNFWISRSNRWREGLVLVYYSEHNRQNYFCGSG